MSEIRRVESNLYPNSRYVVRVRAINPYNTPSEWSESLVFVTTQAMAMAPPPSPTKAPILSQSYSGITITLVPPEDLPDPSAYILEHSLSESGPFDEIAILTETDTFYHATDTSVENFYRFKVRDEFELESDYSPVANSEVIVSGGGIAGDSIFFHMSGTVEVSPAVVAKKVFRADATSLEIVGTLGTAGSSSTIVTLYKNGASVGTLTMGASEFLATATIVASFVAMIDYLTARVTTAGLGATELGVEVRAI